MIMISSSNSGFGVLSFHPLSLSLDMHAHILYICMYMPKFESIRHPNSSRELMAKTVRSGIFKYEF
jgi:hypothetical protein